MEVRTNTLTPELFLELYTSVGWEPPCIEQVQEALHHTIATFTAYHKHEAVGMVGLIGEHLENYIRNSIPSEWAVSLELISTKEAVSFYQKMGFEERPCAWDGPGMFKMIR